MPAHQTDALFNRVCEKLIFFILSLGTTTATLGLWSFRSGATVANAPAFYGPLFQHSALTQPGARQGRGRKLHGAAERDRQQKGCDGQGRSGGSDRGL